MHLTPEQHAAIYTHDRNLVVVAGAGSGKTHVLVERYLALLEANPDWPLSALVAITFTQKAAQEMRDRVRQTVEKRLRDASSEAEVAAWSARLTTMDSARIDTIHALCKSILAANAAQAGVDPGFNIIDEIEARILLENVVEQVFRQIAELGDATIELFAEYDSYAIRDTVMAFIHEHVLALPEDIFAHWQQQWQAAFTEAFAAFFQGITSVYDPVGDDWLSQVWRDCNGLLSALEESQTTEERLACLQGLMALKMRGGAALKAWGDDFQASKEALVVIRDGARAVIENVRLGLGAVDERAARLLPLWVSLIRRIQSAYQRAKDAQSVLDFNDLEGRTRDLLHACPDVAARYVQSEFRHLLVDEFQDTNSAQWDIIRALAPPEAAGSLFIVGDAKQSIYAFRGADVSVFEQVQQHIVSLNGHRVPLDRSFRTHAPLVSCFNHLFERLLLRDEDSPARAYQIASEPMQAARAEPPCDEAFFELILLDKARLQAQNEDMTTDDVRRWEAYSVGMRIHELVESGRQVYDKSERHHRPIEYGDVALLFQSMTRANLYEDVFKALRLPFVTVAGQGYFDRQEVHDLIHLLNTLYNPADNLALAAVLRSPLFSLSDDALLALRLIRDPNGASIPLWDALSIAAVEPLPDILPDEQPLLEFASLTLGELQQLAGRVTIAELLQEALDRTGYLAVLTGLPDGARRRGNVEKLLDKARTSGKLTLEAFSQYLHDLTTLEAREGEALLEVSGAVTLMSVHKSKGLEFPVVVLMDSSWPGKGGGGPLLVKDAHYGLACKALDLETNALEQPFAYRRAAALQTLREDAERRRLLYVAATRAQDCLLVSGQVSLSRSGSWSAAGWLGWLLDALDLREMEAATQSIEYPWGTLAVRFPDLPPATLEDGGGDGAAWEAAPIRGVQPLAGVPSAVPALVAPHAVQRDAAARVLTAIQIAELGSMREAEEGPAYRRRLRRSLLHDAPSFIEPVSSRQRLVSRLKIERVAHHALRWWRLPSADDDLSTLLRSYAWDEGVVEDRQLAYAVDEARQLLAAFAHSDVATWVREADEVFHQVPFVYDTGGRIVHGQIDLVIRRADGAWTIVDFKVGGAADEQLLPQHAQRYALLAGVYATVFSEHIKVASGADVVPDVYIHYIRHGATVVIPRQDWQAALAGLEDSIGDLLR